MEEIIRLGTSGWTYEHWKGKFYPKGLAKSKWFLFFSEHFNTVELNASFYRIPSRKAAENWQNKSPDSFLFAVKMSRLVTHIKKLKDCDRELEWFFSVFEPMREKVGIYLIQLPPSLKCNPERLHSFAQRLPENARYAIEFRNKSWYNEEVYSLLRDMGFTFCIHDMGECSTERIITSDTVYIRFHGHHSHYGGDYPDEILDEWAHWILSESKKGTRIFGYFNNDIDGYAIKNSTQLRKIIERESVAVE